MGSKGSNTVSQQTSSSPDPAAMAAYKQLLTSTQGLAQTPYVPYTGEGVAPVNPQQYSGIGQINMLAQEAQPYYGLAGGLMAGAAQPLTTQQIGQYYSPFTQYVGGATVDWLNQLNAQQDQRLLGNAVSQGALGGDREAIARATLAGQQAFGEAPTLANIAQQGYQSALQTAAQQFQQNPESVAFGLGNLGTGAQAAALTGAGAVVGAGSLEQQTQQALDQYLFQQYLAKQGYPFALNQYAAGIETGVGSLMGGTTTGTTTYPAPNPISSLFGAGIAGLGMAGNLGWKPFAARGGGINRAGRIRQHIRGLQAGGTAYPTFGGGYGQLSMPYASAPSYVSGIGITRGPGPPRVGAPSMPQQQDSANSMIQNAMKMAGGFKGGAGGAGSSSGDPAVWDLRTAGEPLDLTEGASAADEAMAAEPAVWDLTGAGVGDVAGMGADVGAGVMADLGIDAGAGAAADMLPLLLLAKRGGRINRQGGGPAPYAGLPMPTRNRIQLPMRAGLGMPSFVPGMQRGFQDGGGESSYAEQFPASSESVAEQIMRNQETTQGYGLTPSFGDRFSASYGDVARSDALPDTVPLPMPRPTVGQTSDPEVEAGTALALDPSEPVWRRAGLLSDPDAPTRPVADNAAAGIEAAIRRNLASSTSPSRAMAYGDTAPTAGLQVDTTPRSERPSIVPKPGFSFSPELNQALIAAGFGMMASRSPYLGVAIGEGGLTGLQTYTGLKEKEADVEMRAKQLDQQAKFHADTLQHQQDVLAETKQTREFQEKIPRVLGDHITYNDQGYPIRSDKVYGIWDRGKRAWVDNAGNPVDINKLNNVPPDVKTGGPQPYPATPTAPAAPSFPSSAVPGVPYRLPTGKRGGRIPHRQGGGPAWMTGLSADPSGGGDPGLSLPAASAVTASPEDTAPSAERPFRGVTATTATEKEASNRGLHGQAYLDAVPADMRNQVEAGMNYQTDLSEFPPNPRFDKMTGIRVPSRKEAEGMVLQANPLWDKNYIPTIKKLYSAFFVPGTSTSPAQQSLRYNTAVGHAGDLAQAFVDLHNANPGLLQAARASGMPVGAYLAAHAQQYLARGTGSPTADAIQKIMTIEPLFVHEQATFYSPSGGDVESRKAMSKPYDPSLSLPEQITALRTAAHMFKSKTDPLEQDYKEGLSAPGLAQYGTRSEFKQWTNTKQRAQETLDNLEQLYQRTHPTGAAEWIRQNPMDPKAQYLKQVLGIQ